MTFFTGHCKKCDAEWIVGTVDGATKTCPSCGALRDNFTQFLLKKNSDLKNGRINEN